ncbi:glycosyltransferase family 2 protein [Sulfitobacter aestuariivivens]|uniref:Glycosyltransferase family 2 protein n=1 Tax=Sulfitobacter aestuariivivens TaxID=2766981 RepID=A0A927D1Z5_9RHOB|nr:glycosyltransferase family 2 protein [Sulfitobacter aestuariivivens]MBD3663544.1 glycosyltransferase family 2 protein [Sulfitobacter aestuariivivens]
MTDAPTWGLSATILAPFADTLRFAAFHLEAGAHRLYIYLDQHDSVAFDALKSHPKCRVTTCDTAYWNNHQHGRPKKHQVRQTMNATHAYARRAEVDWLIHMDVDEFLVSDRPIGETLAVLPHDALAARVRPMELLSGGTSAFKLFIPPGPGRAQTVRDLYPTFGAHTQGGFLSHLAGKVFARTALDDVRIQIHNAFQAQKAIDTVDLPQDTIALAHCHAGTWDAWLAAYRYRLAHGSYRAELAPNRARDKGGLTLHEVFQTLETKDGEAGLRAFFDEVCADTPRLRRRLDDKNLLRMANLDLDDALSTHFPHVTL